MIDWSRFVIFLLAVLLASGGVGCGYRVASQNRLGRDLSTLAVRPLVNRTSTFEVEQLLTRALVREFVRRTGYSVVSDESGADAVVEGTVSRVTANPVTFEDSNFASTFLVTLYIGIEMKDRVTGEILFRQPDYIFRDQYVINQQVESFFSEANPALERMAEDFAASVVSTILEGF